MTLNLNFRHGRGQHPDSADLAKQRSAPGNRRGFQDAVWQGKTGPQPGEAEGGVRFKTRLNPSKTSFI